MRIAAFTGKNKDFRLYLMVMKTWAIWEKAGPRMHRLKNQIGRRMRNVK